MNLDQLNLLCRQSTRGAFEEFKRQVETRLFPFDNSLKETLQRQMLEHMRQGVVKTLFKENTLGKIDCRLLDDVLNQYSHLVLKVSNNYSKQFL